MKKKAFSFLEIIVSIVIIGILLSASSLAIKKWMTTARDVDRNTNLTLISNGLKQYMYKNDFFPMPDNAINITASGDQNIIGYQGYFGENVANIINTRAPKDPTDNFYYTYYVNGSSNLFEVMGYFERSQLSMGNTVYAGNVDYTKKYISTKGDKAGILVNYSDNKPLQEVFSGKYDIINGSQNLWVYFSNSDYYNMSGSSILTIKSLYDKSLAVYDTGLVAYRDMSTLSNSGTNLVLKDFSKNGNNGVCYNSGTIVNCGSYGLGPQIITSPTGKAMQFDGIDDKISIDNNSSINIDATVNPVSIFCILKISDNTRIHPIVIKPLQYGFGILASGYLRFSDVQGVGYTSTIPLLSGNYNTIFGQKQISPDSTISLFLGGTKIGSSTAGTWHVGTSTNNMSIGTDGTYLLSGTIDEIRIYNRILSDNEVKAIYNSYN